MWKETFQRNGTRMTVFDDLQSCTDINRLEPISQKCLRLSNEQQEASFGNRTDILRWKVIARVVCGDLRRIKYAQTESLEFQRRQKKRFLKCIK